MKLRFTVMLLALLSGAHADDLKHFEAAKEHVLINLNVTNPHDIAEKLTNGLLMRQPQNQPFKEVYVSFFEKIFTSDEYVDSYAKLYMEHMSLEELEYANKVFSDPKMADYMKKTPIIMEQAMIMGQQLMQKHGDELQVALQERAKEIEFLGGK